jgi:hypothetical protein
MALSTFDDKDKQPQSADLRSALGRSAGAWQELVSWLEQEYAPLAKDWIYSGQQWGWSLRLKQKKRAILYLTPREKFFHAGLVLGEKAAKVALAMDLPTDAAKEVKTAKRYAEGRAIRLDVRFKKDLGAVKMLARAKMST